MAFVKTFATILLRLNLGMILLKHPYFNETSDQNIKLRFVTSKVTYTPHINVLGKFAWALCNWVLAVVRVWLQTGVTNMFMMFEFYILNTTSLHLQCIFRHVNSIFNYASSHHKVGKYDLDFNHVDHNVISWAILTSTQFISLSFRCFCCFIVHLFTAKKID